MSEKLEETITGLLPPATAVRMVWARTGVFSTEAHSQLADQLSVYNLKNIQEKAQSNERERRYITAAVATMDAAFRNLDVIYKGRQLNFKENEMLRNSYLESIKENLDFGNKLSDFVKSLPTMVISVAGGVTLASYFFKNNEFLIWTAGIVMSAVGYLANMLIVKLMRKRIQKQYVVQDYERSLYYDQYITRVVSSLTSLYMDLDRIHKNVFGVPYPIDLDSSDVINDMLKGARPTFCKYLHKHMEKGLVKPSYWAVCETGIPFATEHCPLWEGKNS